MMLKKKSNVRESQLRREAFSKSKSGMKGKQGKLDVDKDGKITGKDFKMLKKIKKK